MVFTTGTRKAPGDLLKPDTVRGYDVRSGEILHKYFLIFILTSYLCL